MNSEPKKEGHLREQVRNAVGRLREDMIEIARKIHAHPEIGYQEYEACRILSDYLEANGFHVERSVAGMPTAFRAQYPVPNERPCVALLAEYDALPGLGHACAHNLIGTAAVAAATGLRRSLDPLPGTVMVLGCPAEEAGIDDAGGKIRMIEAGIFNDVDAAMYFHPMPVTTVGGNTTALVGLEFEFIGKAAHAAGNPWDGANALDGVLQTYNSINALRQHIRADARVHGIITHGGEAPNIIPERAVARFFLRAAGNFELEELIEKVENCAKGAAMATGTQLKTHRFSRMYQAMNTNSVLARVLSENLKAAGLAIEGKKKGLGSTDFGNVSHVVPACELAIRLGKGLVPHTREFLRAANSEEGFDVMMLGAEIMATSALDLLTRPQLLAEARKTGRTIDP